MATPELTPPPPGFKLDGDIPPPPPGFKIDSPEKKAGGVWNMFGPTEAALSLGSGMIAGPVAGLAGIAGGLLPGPQGQGADWVNRVSNALTYEPRTEAGGAVNRLVQYLPEKLAHGADALGERTTDATGSPLLGAAANTATQMLPAILLKGAGMRSAANAPARTITTAENAPRDAIAMRSRDAGYAAAPSETPNAGMLSKTAESLSGSGKTIALMNEKNAPLTNQLIRRDVGIPEGTPSTREAHAAIRETEGAKYDYVAKTGQVNLDPKYLSDIAKIEGTHKLAAADFAHRSENPLRKVLDGLTKNEDGSPKTSFDAGSAVAEIKLLRKDATKAYAAKDASTGAAYADMAKALDDALERHVRTTPGLNPIAVRDYLQARVKIAKSYMADKALNEATGNYDASVYADAMKAGKRLSGDSKTVGEFAAQSPKSAALPTKASGPTMFDAMPAWVGHLLAGSAGAAGYAAAGPPGIGAATLMAARPLTRQALLSDLVQRRIAAPYRTSPLLSDYAPPTLADLQASEGQRK